MLREAYDAIFALAKRLYPDEQILFIPVAASDPKPNDVGPSGANIVVWASTQID